MTGSDAKDYLHRMTTANAQELQTGQGTLGCFLTAQAKIRSFFRLWQIDKGDFAFELDAGLEAHWKTGLLTAIDQFHFGEKFVIHDHPKGLECLWAFGAMPATALAAESASEAKLTHAFDEVSGCHVCHQGPGDYGRPWVTVWGTASQIETWQRGHAAATQSVDFEELEAWRIQALRPRADTEIREDSIPLEIGLKDSIADNKGCYPGQEVIEKIVALGAPARRLALIEGHGQIPVSGDKILNSAEPPSEVGQVTSVTHEASGNFYALGVLRKTHAKEGLEVKFGTGSAGKVVRIAPYV